MAFFSLYFIYAKWHNACNEIGIALTFCNIEMNQRDTGLVEMGVTIVVGRYQTMKKNK